MLGSVIASLRGNPIFTRHLNTTFTGPRLAGAFLLVMAAQVILYMTVFVNAGYKSGGRGFGFFYVDVDMTEEGAKEENVGEIIALSKILI